MNPQIAPRPFLDLKWEGNLRHDCTASMHGFNAHVEQMDRGQWWFAVRSPDGAEWNSSEHDISPRTGKEARLFAEFVLSWMSEPYRHAVSAFNE
jgi:hypothetical protein